MNDGWALDLILCTVCITKENTSLGILAIVKSRSEILAGLAVRRKVFDAACAEMMRAEMKVTWLGIVVGGCRFGHFVELVGNDSARLIRDGKVAADTLVKIMGTRRSHRPVVLHLRAPHVYGSRALVGW